MYTYDIWSKFRKKRIRRKEGVFPKEQLPAPCKYCGVILTKDTATIDHVVPMSKGGSKEQDNLVWSCLRCNTRKKDKILEGS